MSVFTKIVTSVFGRKSDRDMKILTPYIDKINSIYNELNDLIFAYIKYILKN